MAPIPRGLASVPLYSIRSWAPFRIDALGLVSLIGAEEVNSAIGRLVYSGYTEFLPLLGAYLTVGERFSVAVPGYTIYNLSDAITTTTISGWFGRWLSYQKLSSSNTAFRFEVSATPRKRGWRAVLALPLGLFGLGGLILLTVLTEDWYGMSNAIVMCLSVFARWFLVHENRASLDRDAVLACYGTSIVAGRELTIGSEEDKPSQEQIKPAHYSTYAKLMITLPNGNMVTVRAPNTLVKQMFIYQPKPLHSRACRWVKGIGWFAFGVHVIALGQSNLLCQIYAVLLLTLSSWSTVRGAGCNEHEIGNHISITRTDYPPPNRRLHAYVRLDPSREEEDSMYHWGLFPQKVNVAWWNEYEAARGIKEQG